ncbi:hypothetical protein J1N35_025128 [Gossypium stocksii]|uniref:PNPLA domain-containing protein n=1 Tax=Gossypium stocksii TaxID=47602 RepID=A0A9D3V6D3_9ROSI|nr:hypothetical protein J1N35_025128 [Gossypium stocksii]
MGNRREAPSVVTSTLTDQFDSKEDLINAVITSSFIPRYLTPRQATMFQNRLCIDGGLTLFMPPTSASKIVKRHKVGVPTQQQATPNQQEGTSTQQVAPNQLPTAPTHQQAALRQKLPFKRKPTTVRWMPSTQESSMTDH